MAFIVKSKKDKAPVKSAFTTKGIYAPVALLELFTSEGCSSCPPADALLASLAKENKTVIPLSFHVDYWNRLGWTDPFSDAAYSNRQNLYGAKLGLESVYTPQLIINGQYEGVGSNRNFAGESIQKSLSENALVKISLSGFVQDKQLVRFTTGAEGNLKGTDLFAALVENTASSQVKAGENRGALLTHINIVRVLKRQDAASLVSFTLNLPADVADGNWKIVLFTQEKSSGKITGAFAYNPVH